MEIGSAHVGVQMQLLMIYMLCNGTITKRPIIQNDLPYYLDQITMTELDAALRKAKNHKAPGPDGIQAELCKYLDIQNKTTLLSVLNGWWSKEAISQTS